MRSARLAGLLLAATILIGCTPASPAAQQTTPAAPYSGTLPTRATSPASQPSRSPVSRTREHRDATAWCPKVARTFRVGTSRADDVVTAARAALRVIARAAAEPGLPRPIRIYLRDSRASFAVLATGNRYPSSAEMAKIQKPLLDLPTAKASYAAHCARSR